MVPFCEFLNHENVDVHYDFEFSEENSKSNNNTTTTNNIN